MDVADLYFALIKVLGSTFIYIITSVTIHNFPGSKSDLYIVIVCML